MVASNVRINALDSFGVKTPNKKDPYAAMEAARGLFPLQKVSLTEWSGKPANNDLFVVVRTDTGQVIGQVGANYECFDNRSFFGPVAESLVKHSGAEIERFQMLDSGTRSFMRLSWPKEKNLRIGRAKVGDIVGRRCTLSTSHDGKYAGKFNMMMLRLACSNGLMVPCGTYEIVLTHTTGGHTQLKDLQELVPTIDRYVTSFEAAANILVGTRVDPKSDLCREVVQKIADPNKAAKPTKAGEPNRAQTRINRIMGLFAGEQPGADEPEMKGTAWGLYNAFVDYCTHDKGTRGEDENEQRFRSLLPGSGSASREILRAWDVIVDGVGVRKEIEAAIA